MSVKIQFWSWGKPRYRYSVNNTLASDIIGRNIYKPKCEIRKIEDEMINKRETEILAGKKSKEGNLL